MSIFWDVLVIGAGAAGLMAAGQAAASGASTLLVEKMDRPGRKLLITGKGPFDPQLLQGEAAARGADWPESFSTAAQRGGWRTDMVWYRTVQTGG